VQLAEALAAAGTDVEIVALGRPEMGLYRPVQVPYRIIPSPEPARTLTRRVFDSLEALTHGLASLGDDLPAILHAQDCIAARAACRLRDGGAPTSIVRTVHHVDDFTTPALVSCQQAAITEPDRVLVVSRAWQRTLDDDYGVHADVVPNGVDVTRFAKLPPVAVTGGLRARVGATGRPLVLAVGGIEPRKGSDHLVRALALLKRSSPRCPVLAVVGGHSFQDHAGYRDAVLGSLDGLGLVLGVDVVLVGTVPDEEIPAWYHAADVLAFPSVSEGWGLAILEAMASGLPVVATDLAVFLEYLQPGRDALLVAPGDDVALADAIKAALVDEPTSQHLVDAGRRVAARFGWDASARRHLEIYEEVRVLAASRP
jgi:glycosyltransferase-like protein